MIKVANLSTSSEYFKWNFIDKPSFDISQFIKDKDHIYDADNCGNSMDFWAVVVDGHPKFYKSDHSWYWHNYGQDDSELINEFDIVEVSSTDLDDEAKKNLRFVV